MNEGIYAYPHFGYSEQEDDLSGLVGKTVYWTLKEDGSNCGIYYDEKVEKFRVRSRNLDVAAFESKVIKLRAFDYCCELIKKIKKCTGDDIMVFCELLAEGRSPTGIKVYSKDDLVVFDIYNMTKHKYYEYNSVAFILDTLAFKYKNDDTYSTEQLMFAPLIEVTEVKSVEHLKETIARLLELIKDYPDARGVKGVNEGIVGKVYEHCSCSHGNNYFFMKEKNYIERPPKIIGEDTPKRYLPVMSEEDFRACFFKAKAELDESQWRDKSKAMPKIAEEIGKECKQQGCKVPRNIYLEYCSLLKEDKND